MSPRLDPEDQAPADALGVLCACHTAHGQPLNRTENTFGYLWTLWISSAFGAIFGAISCPFGIEKVKILLISLNFRL